MSDIPINEIPKKKTEGDSGPDSAPLPYREAKEKFLSGFNHDYINAKLSMTQGNVTQAAKLCRMDRQALQQIMKRYNIDPDHFR